MWPFSVKYGLVMQFRNYLYDKGFFKIHHFKVPVISIGNISAGGTGKTPFTIFLAENLIQRGKKVAIVSRGYGRKSKGFRLVSDGTTFSANPIVHGDEPALISRRLPKAIIAVAEKRYIAIKHLLDNFSVDIILLDDGFQHRSVYRKVDIVLVREWNTPDARFVIPAGLLREFKTNLSRANLIVNAGKEKVPGANYSCAFISEEVIDSDFNIIGKITDFSDQDAIAFSAIAKSQNFLNGLTNAGIHIKKQFIFKDHYYFTSHDLDKLADECRNRNVKYLFCTEKDLIKINVLKEVKRKIHGNNIKLLAPRLRVLMNDEKSFFENLQGMLD